MLTGCAVGISLHVNETLISVTLSLSFQSGKMIHYINIAMKTQILFTCMNFILRLQQGVV